MFTTWYAEGWTFSYLFSMWWGTSDQANHTVCLIFCIMTSSSCLIGSTKLYHGFKTVRIMKLWMTCRYSRALVCPYKTIISSSMLWNFVFMYTGVSLAAGNQRKLPPASQNLPLPPSTSVLETAISSQFHRQDVRTWCSSKVPYWITSC